MPAAPSVRLTGGDFAGRVVRGAAGATRPATARLRRSIFDRPDVLLRLDGHVLDLYAGAGLLGLEALSRGAPAVDFVEHSRHACDVIRANLSTLGGAHRARVHCRPVARARAVVRPPYSLCFADPPYLHDAASDLGALLHDGLLAPHGLLLWRRPRDRPAPERIGHLVRHDQRRYGDGVLDTFAYPPRWAGRDRGRHGRAPSGDRRRRRRVSTAVYPGGFDPLTNGHLDIIARAAALFDHVVIGVYQRSQSELFSAEDRVALIEEAVQSFANVRVEGFTGLVVNYARAVGATVLVRGIRAVTDFEAEFDMALMNKKMAPEIESVYLMANLDHLFISASRIREIAALGQPVDDLVPPNVDRVLRERFGPVQID